MDTMGGFFGFLGLACGIYVLYAWYQMKTTGEINATILLPKSENPNRCKDKKAYIQAVLPKLLVLGISAVAYGVIDIIGVEGTALWVVLAVFMAILLWFGVTTSKLYKKYF